MTKHLTRTLAPLAIGAAVTIAAAVAVPALAAPAAEATAFKVPAVSVALSAKTVHAPGKLTVSLHSSACVSDVQAVAYNSAHGTVTRSTVIKGSGTKFTVTITFPAKAPAGAEVIADVFARPCTSTRPGQVALLPAHASFPLFKVTRG